MACSTGIRVTRLFVLLSFILFMCVRTFDQLHLRSTTVPCMCVFDWQADYLSFPVHYDWEGGYDFIFDPMNHPLLLLLGSMWSRRDVALGYYLFRRTSILLCI